MKNSIWKIYEPNDKKDKFSYILFYTLLSKNNDQIQFTTEKKIKLRIDYWRSVLK